MSEDVIIQQLQRLIRRAMGDPDWTPDPDLDGRALLSIMRRRTIWLIRGLCWSWRLGACQMPFFVGRRVELLHPSRVRIGRRVILEDDVHIDALSRRGVVIGNRVCLAKYTIIEASALISNLGEGVEIGDFSALGHYCFVGGAGGVHIGRHVLVGQRVSFHPENHVFARVDVAISEQGVTRRGITVEDDCWIGAGVIVLDGVRIGHGSVIAAGSVVTKSIPPYSVAVGVPARVVRSRSSVAANPLVG